MDWQQRIAAVWAEADALGDAELVRRIDARLCLHVLLDRARGPAFGLTRVLVDQRIREALEPA